MYMLDNQELAAQVKLPNLISAILEKTGPVEINVKNFLEADISNKQIVITYNENNESFVVGIGDVLNGSN